MVDVVRAEQEEFVEYEDNQQLFNFVSGVVLGAIIGAGIALLTAPNNGQRTRKTLVRAAGDLRHGATDRFDELADDMKRKVDETVKAARKRIP